MRPTTETGPTLEVKCPRCGRVMAYAYESDLQANVTPAGHLLECSSGHAYLVPESVWVRLADQTAADGYAGFTVPQRFTVSG